MNRSTVTLLAQWWRLGFLEGAATESERFHPWIQAAVDAHAVQFLATSAVELENLEAWGDHPDVAEGDVGELTAPLGGDADSAAEGHEHVAQIFPAVEAFVGELPHAVHRVGALGLGEEVLEGDLKMVIDAVGVTVDEIDVCHVEVCVTGRLKSKENTADAPTALPAVL